MIRLILLTSGLLLVINAGALMAMREWGGALPASPSYLEPGNCRQPCWRGVQPGTQDDGGFAQAIASIGNRYQAALIRGEGQRIQEIQLDLYGDIRLGEVMLALGTPSHAQLRYVAGLAIDVSSATPPSRRVFVGGTLYFGEGLIEVTARREDQRWVFAPEMIVVRIRYFAPSAEDNIVPLGTPRWHGFGTSYGEPFPVR